MEKKIYAGNVLFRATDDERKREKKGTGSFKCISATEDFL